MVPRCRTTLALIFGVTKLIIPLPSRPAADVCRCCRVCLWVLSWVTYVFDSPGRRCSHRGEALDGTRAAEKEFRRPTQALVRNPAVGPKRSPPLARRFSLPCLAFPSLPFPCVALPHLALPCLTLPYASRGCWMGQVRSVQGEEHADVGAGSDSKIEGSYPCGRPQAEGQCQCNCYVLGER